MDIDLSKEDLAFRDEVRSFFEDSKIKDGEDYFSWREGWFKKAREKGGWDVPKWPAKFGGPGWTPTQHYIWEQETAKANIPFDLPFGLGMLAPILMNYGTEEQQQRFLPDIRDRIWTTLAHIADWIFCLTRTDDSGIKQQGITFLLFPMKQEGIEVKPIITLGGSHTVNTVHFTDVKVPVENRIGEEGKGWTYAKGLLEHERTGLAGLSKSLVELEQLKDKARTVQRGNGNLMDDASYKSKVGELEIDLLATEFTELRSLASAAAGGEPGPESSILKLKGTEIKQRIQKLTVEASGIYASAWGDKGAGPSFAKGGTAGYLNSRYFTIYGGASEVQKDIVAKKVLGLTSSKSK